MMLLAACEPPSEGSTKSDDAAGESWETMPL